MKIKYLVQLKGIKENVNCWRTQAVFNNMKDALKLYNFYTSGCCKQILRIRTIEKIKILRFKNYGRGLK